MFLGVVGSYLVALAIGPRPGVSWMFLAGTALWSVLILLPLVAEPQSLAEWRKLVNGRRPRRAGLIAYAMLVAVVSLEVALRLASLSGASSLLAETPAQPQRLSHPARSSHASGESEIKLVNWMANEDLHSVPTKPAELSTEPATFRVAVVGDEMTLSGSADSNCLAQLEAQLAGVEIHNFSLPQAGPRQYATQLIRQVEAVKPNLVLLFVSLSDDITAESPRLSFFDWRSLQTARLVARLAHVSAANDAQQPSPSDADEAQAYLSRAGAELAICRTPLSDRMRARWKVALTDLDALAERCRAKQLPLAIVAVPPQFQVNVALCETLRRRQGCDSSDIDLELPQRRLAAFAAERQVPLLDLLPYLRRAERPVYERNAAGWNDAGNAVAAEALGGWLSSQFRLPQVAAGKNNLSRPAATFMVHRRVGRDS